MASRGLGTLTLDLVAKIGGLTGPMDKAARHTDKRMREIERSAERLGRGIGSSLKAAGTQFLKFAGVTLTVGAAISTLKGAIDNADAMRDLSIRTGLATESLSALAYAAKQTGTDVDGLATGLKFLAKNATAALNPKSKQSGLFEALGVTKDALTDLDKLIPQVADAFARMADGPQKTAVALQLFGKSGADLIEFFNQGSDGLDAFADRARELGIIIGTDTANAADEFNDKLADLKAAGQGLALQIASELLPQLSAMVDWAVAFVSEGGDAEAMAQQLSSGFRDLSEALGSVASIGGSAIGGLERIREVLNGMQDQLAGATRLMFMFGNETERAFAIAQIKSGSAQIDGTRANFSNVKGGVQRGFENVRGGYKMAQPNAALDRFLSGGGGGGASRKSGGGAKSGKSDAEKEQDRLKAGFDNMVASLKEQLALTGEVSEVEKLRYELANGELAKLAPAQKEQLIALQQSVEVRKAEFDALEKAIKLEEKETEAKDDHAKAVKEQIEDMQFELSIIGLTNIEREKAIALRYANVDAMSAEGQQISKLVEDIAKANENQQFFDDLKSGLGDMFVDFVTGAKTAKEAFNDFAQAIFARALQFAADKAIQALFDSFGTKGQGSTGGSSGAGWAGFFASLFGGGKASGGSVQPGMFYRVNEDGPEMLSVRGRDYLMMGNNAGRVTPNRGTMDAGSGQTLNFHYAAPPDPRTQQQTAQRVAFETS
ncbi:MAG: hypothetical protein M3R16_06950, partial [Pseudomonadota bacterium]|nr:hypothetical protein [Pseudomonadota bacterium]